MGLPIKLRHLPTRLAAGAFILNSGVEKLKLDAESAGQLQQLATQALPQLGDLDPKDFGKLLARGEIALGAALLLPVVPSWLAGLALTGFSGALLAIYRATPGLTQEDGVRPTQDGTPIAKDVFLLGIGVGLVLDGLASRKR